MGSFKRIDADVMVRPAISFCWRSFCPGMLQRPKSTAPLFCRALRANLTVGPASGPSGALKKEDNVLSLSSDAARAADAGVSAMANKPQAMSDAPSEMTRALITQTLTKEKAEDIVEIDLRGKSEMGDFMVVASGRSTRQVAALADKLIERLKAERGIVSRVEGKSAGDWVLIDAGDVIVHLFRPEVREFYQLEKMWLSPGDTAAETAASG